MWPARAGKITRNIIMLGIAGYGIFSAPAQGFTTNYEKGRVGFLGQVTDVSCTVTVGVQQEIVGNVRSARAAGSQAGSQSVTHPLRGPKAASGEVWLAPVSLAEVYSHPPGAFLKPQPFTLQLSRCRLDNGPRSGGPDNIRVRWVGGYMVNPVNNENAGYLANTLPDGARNIYLALAVNDNNTLDKNNKIVPGLAGQNQVQMQELASQGGIFTYYVGYITQTPRQVTSGPIITRAVWELVYY